MKYQLSNSVLEYMLAARRSFIDIQGSINASVIIISETSIVQQQYVYVYTNTVLSHLVMQEGKLVGVKQVRGRYSLAHS